MVKTEEKTTEKPLRGQPSQCLLCGQVGPALLYGHWVCDQCKNVVQADALARKRKIEKEGGGPVYAGRHFSDSFPGSAVI